VDHDAVIRRLRGLDRFGELTSRRRPDHLDVEARGVGGKINRQLVTIQPAGFWVPIAVFGAEALRAQHLRKRADGSVAMILHQDRDDLDALLDCRDQLGSHH
jgi:hypothetical protein